MMNWINVSWIDAHVGIHGPWAQAGRPAQALHLRRHHIVNDAFRTTHRSSAGRRHGWPWGVGICICLSGRCALWFVLWKEELISFYIPVEMLCADCFLYLSYHRGARTHTHTLTHIISTSSLLPLLFPHTHTNTHTCILDVHSGSVRIGTNPKGKDIFI